jgi:hypothetical protein
MNETVLKRPIAMPDPKAKAVTKRSSRGNGAVRWYSLLAVCIVAGWYLRDLQLVTPEEGVGYWLGIAGGSLMLLLLLYPLRKRMRFLHGLGATKHWFRMHMIFGLLGPLLILYHSNYQLGSFNSRVAFYCMLLVASSGIIGRHFYAAIHRGLYGRKTSLQELQKDLRASVENSHGLAKLMPKLVNRLEKLSADLQSDRIRQTIGIRRSLKWTFTHTFVRLSLLWTARRELRVAAVRYPVVARERKRIYRTAARYIRDFTVRTGRVAQYSFYDRLFGLWHVLHLPIFFMMVLSALVHVLAVHMY